MKVFVCAVLFVQLVAQAAFAQAGQALTVAKLRKVPDLTPSKFVSYFRDFEYKFHDDVQDHNVFLRSRSGDCDDFATVAADVLAAQGYTPRMIAVRMRGETHVVCYIQETKSYLDYNTRRDNNPMVPCSPQITDIARKVAASFGRDWVATYEFSFNSSENVKRLVTKIIHNKMTAKTDDIQNDHAAARPGASR